KSAIFVELVASVSDDLVRCGGRDSCLQGQSLLLLVDLFNQCLRCDWWECHSPTHCSGGECRATRQGSVSANSWYSWYSPPNSERFGCCSLSRHQIPSLGLETVGLLSDCRFSNNVQSQDC